MDELFTKKRIGFPDAKSEESYKRKICPKTGFLVRNTKFALASFLQRDYDKPNIPVCVGGVQTQTP